MREDEAIRVHPATADRWPDLAALFGPNGASGGCWCMHWRLTSADWHARGAAENRRALKDHVDGAMPPGLLAYRAGNPVGWCSLGKREAFVRLARSYVAKPVDDRPVWSIVCFFVDRRHRRSGVTRALVDAACHFVRRNGGTLVEAYPVDPPAGRRASRDNAFLGLASVFFDAGFAEVARHKSDRPIVRKAL